ncbi:MAG: ABC transporter permease [Oscillospiraceae bacterium]|nr:ABC transporter permease [Oscillospiraceae bacterium]
MLNAIFSVSFLNSVLRMMTPITFAALAACIGRQSDIMCIAYEGMMMFAALGGALGSAFTHSLLLGSLIGIVSGMAIAMIFAYFVLYLDTRPMLIAIALNTIGTAGTIYILYLLTGRKSDSLTMSSLTFPDVTIPFIKNIPFLGDVLSGQNVLTWLAIVMVFVVNALIYKTSFGLRMRSVGQNPSAAVSLGINVRRTKFIAMTMSGFLASLGGLFMSMAYMPYFTKNMVAGRGFMALAACNLAAGRPLVAFLAAIVFGMADSIGNISQAFRLPAQFAASIPYLVTIIGLCFMGVGENKVKKAKK